MSSGHFEAKKHAYRQTQDGVVVSFTVHPNDLDAAFAVAALGTRYMVAFAEIGDDEKPKDNSPVAQRSEPPNHKGLVAGSNPAGATKDRRLFSSLPLSQQAGIRANDIDFQKYTQSENAEEAAKAIRLFCQIKSRAELDGEDGFAKNAWHELENSFQKQVVTVRYAESIR